MWVAGILNPSWIVSEKSSKILCISYHCLTFKHHRMLKLIPNKDKYIGIAHNQYHGCWCPGEAWNQVIRSTVLMWLFWNIQFQWPNGWTLQWRHNVRGSISNHQPHDCFLNRLFRCRSKKTSKLRVTGLCVGNSSVNSPHKWPVTWKMFPFDDVMMEISAIAVIQFSLFLFFKR